MVKKRSFLTSFSSIRINYRLQMIIWYNGNDASNRSEKISRFRKEFESVGWRENGPIDEIISAYSDIFKYFQYLFNLILNHSESFGFIQNRSKSFEFFQYGYFIPIKGNILIVSHFLFSFPKSAIHGPRPVGSTAKSSNVIILKIILKNVIILEIFRHFEFFDRFEKWEHF